MNKCIHSECDSFARSLTKTEFDNVLSFNLSRSTVQDILRATLQEYCPYHAARSLKDVEIDNFVLSALREKWEPLNQSNFSDSEKYACCVECSTHLRRGINSKEVATRDKKVVDTLEMLDIPEERINTIVYLQGYATNGMGTCFDCCLKLHTEYDLDKGFNIITTDLDDLAAASIKRENSRVVAI